MIAQTLEWGGVGRMTMTADQVKGYLMPHLFYSPILAFDWGSV